MTDAADTLTLLDLGNAEVAALHAFPYTLQRLTLAELVSLSGRIGISKANLAELPEMPAVTRMDYQLRVMSKAIASEILRRIQSGDPNPMPPVVLQ